MRDLAHFTANIGVAALDWVYGISSADGHGGGEEKVRQRNRDIWNRWDVEFCGWIEEF
jgi:hypothetical protein